MKKTVAPASPPPASGFWPLAVPLYPICLLSLLLGGSAPALAQFTQQTPSPLVGAGWVGPSIQGYSGALSADGNTALVGAPFDNYPTGGGFTGAMFVYTRSNGLWRQQGPKLVGTLGLLAAQGWSVALSADGNTAIAGGPQDGIASHGNGAFWVFTRTNGVWSQQGGKLIPSDVSPGASVSSQVGYSVALSADGNTALVGGPGDKSQAGAAWVFTRSNGIWSQQGAKLTGTASGAFQGVSVALSADGNTAAIGGPNDSPVAGLPCDPGVQILPAPFLVQEAGGAVWVFTRSNGVWSQQGSKLTGSGAVGGAIQGHSVSLSADGNLLLVGGPLDESPRAQRCQGVGATWAFTRSHGAWIQLGSKFTGTGSFNNGAPGPYQQVKGLSADGGTALIGGFGTYYPNPSTGFTDGFVGGAWVFTQPVATHFAVSAPASAAGGAAFPFTVTAQDANNTTIPGYLGTVQFTSTDGAAILPAAATLVNGTGTFFATLNTSGNQTIAAADVAVPTIAGASGAIAVGASTHFTVSAPASATGGTPFNFTVTAMDSSNHTLTGYSGAVHFTSSDPRATLPADATLVNGTGTFSAALRTGGNQTITAADTSNAATSGTSSFIAVTALAAPAPVSVSPAGGNAAAPTFTFVFTDPRGYQDLSVVNILVNDFLDGRHACYLAYVVATNALLLVDDAGDAGGPFAGSQNSQCAVTLVSATGSGNNLTLVLTIVWTASFAGDKIIHMAARDTQEDNSGWQPLGVARVPGGAQTTATAVVGMSPNRGTGLGPIAFTFNWSDTKGAADPVVQNMLINSSLDGRNACYMAYSHCQNCAPTGVVYLQDDSGAESMSGVGLDQTGSLSNSQCTVSWAPGAANASGNNLAVTLNLTFTPAFAGNRVVYMASRQANGDNNTGWHAVGTWTPQ